MLPVPQVIGSNFGFHQHSLGYFLSAMKQLGMDKIELWATASHFDFMGGGESEIERVRQRLLDAQVTVECLTLEQVSYPLNIASPEPGLARRSVEHFLRAADAAVRLGSSTLFLTSGRGVRDVSKSESWARAVEAVRRIVSYAGDLGLSCVLEPLQPHESDLVNSLQDLVEFVDAVDDDRLKVVLDTVAMATANDTVADYFSAFPQRVGHVHLVDGTPRGHLAWGDGNLPMNDYVQQLMQHGYSGNISFEIYGPESYRDDPIGILRDCLQRYRDATQPAA